MKREIYSIYLGVDWKMKMSLRALGQRERPQ